MFNGWIAKRIQPQFHTLARYDARYSVVNEDSGKSFCLRKRSIESPQFSTSFFYPVAFSIQNLLNGWCSFVRFWSIMLLLEFHEQNLSPSAPVEDAQAHATKLLTWLNQRVNHGGSKVRPIWFETTKSWSEKIWHERFACWLVSCVIAGIQNTFLVVDASIIMWMVIGCTLRFEIDLFVFFVNMLQYGFEMILICYNMFYSSFTSSIQLCVFKLWLRQEIMENSAIFPGGICPASRRFPGGALLKSSPWVMVWWCRGVAIPWT